jgi:predicted nucleotidyltransferase
MIRLYDAVKLLANADVEFVVIGGVALTSHGSAYVTQDLDICFARNKENLKKIAAALGPYHPRPRGLPEGLPFVWDWTTLQNGTNSTFRTTLCDIDLLGEVPGVGDFSDVLENSIEINLDGLGVRILSIDGLIAAKETAGRPKDQAGLAELYAIREALDTSEE